MDGKAKREVVSGWPCEVREVPQSSICVCDGCACRQMQVVAHEECRQGFLWIREVERSVFKRRCLVIQAAFRPAAPPHTTQQWVGTLRPPFHCCSRSLPGAVKLQNTSKALQMHTDLAQRRWSAQLSFLPSPLHPYCQGPLGRCMWILATLVRTSAFFISIICSLAFWLQATMYQVAILISTANHGTGSNEATNRDWYLVL